jgi:hypothetical protein
MSLHTLANHLQSAGRGEDKVLVHMTPGEVNGLQSLAMAQGGSLTINPETGLPEAGILRSLLPMIAGFALGPAGFGLFQTAMGAGLAVGAATGLATGSLKQGIMAGMGAYGGAGLGQGLMAQGAGAVAPAQAGLSPAVAANTSTLAGTSPLANVGAQPFQFTDDILAGVAKAPVAGPGQSVVFNQAGAAATPFPTYAQTQANMLQSPMLRATPPAPAAVTTSTSPVTSSAYAPTSNFDVGRNLSGTGATSAAITPPTPTLGMDRISSISAQTRPVSLAEMSYAPGTGPVSPDMSYAINSGNYVPIEARNLPMDGRVVRSELLPGGPPVADPQSITGPFRDRMSQVGRGFEASTKDFEGLKGLYNAMPTGSVIASGLTLAEAMKPEKLKEQKDKSLIRPYDFDYGATGAGAEPYSGSGERLYFNPMFTARTPYEAPGREYAAAGGLMGYAAGGPVEQMANMNYVGMNTGYPMASLQTPMYSNPTMQTPEATNVIAPSADAGVGSYSGELRFARGGGTAEPESSGYTYDYDPTTMQFTQTGGPTSTANNGPFNLIGRALAGANNSQPTTPNGSVSGGMVQPMMQPAAPAQPFIPNINTPAYQTPEQQLGLGGFYDYMNQQMRGYAGYAAGGNVGGISHLGDYSDGGRLLKGPGDGVSDSIPASIGNRQPARLADGEFVVPARIVSELGNGSTEAGARKLYAMMERVQRARRKTVGKDQVARNTKAEKLLPA